MSALRRPAQAPLSRDDRLDAAQTRLSRIVDDIRSRSPSHRNIERNIEDLEAFERMVHALARGERERLNRIG